MTHVTYDLRTQPWSIGDLLLTLGVARRKFGRFDLVLLHDPAIRPRDFEFVPRAPGAHLTLLQDVAQAIKGCESVTVSDQPGDWPEDTSTYLFRWLYDQLDEWPVLECKSDYVLWAEAFCMRHEIDGVCHVRRRSLNPERNSRVLSWNKFFGRIDCRVALIGDAPELARENVIVPPAGVGHQLALIQVADWYMGAGSGPCQMAIFGTAPYRIFNSAAVNVSQFAEGGFVYGPDNKWFPGQESASLLTEQWQELRERVTA